MENNTTQHDDLMQNVLRKIRTGEVKMQPKIYFILKVALLVCVFFLLLITSALLISFIIFSVHASGESFLLGYGTQGIIVFFLLFPWKILLLDLILLIVLEKLIKYFKFGYRHSLVSLLLGLVLFSLFIAFLINITPVHGILLDRAEKKRLPVIGDMYSGVRHPPRDQGIVRGKVNSISGNTFTVEPDENRDDHPGSNVEIKDVIAPANVNLQSFLKIGDMVFAAGKIVGGELHAYGITKFTEENY